MYVPPFLPSSGGHAAKDRSRPCATDRFGLGGRREDGTPESASVAGLVGLLSAHVGGINLVQIPVEAAVGVPLFSGSAHCCRVPGTNSFAV